MFKPDKSPLISADDLSKILERANVKTFDVRGKWGGTAEEAVSEYQKCHIPGAIFLDWKTHFLASGLPTNMAPVAPEGEARQAFEALGISDGDMVVLYDDYHHMMAGRIWWAMRYWGFSNVKVLNGGWKHWSDHKFATSSDFTDPSKGSFEPKENEGLEVSLETLVATKDRVDLVDARGPISFAGNDEDVRSGHIPGARNIPYSELLDNETGLFKDDSALNELFQIEFPDFKERPIISSCGSGYAGTVALIALMQIGVDAVLFDGSFSVWKANPDLPVERSV